MRTSFLVGLLAATAPSVTAPGPAWCPHPGPPVHLEVVIEAERVEFRFSGEQATALAWFRDTGAPALGPAEVPAFVQAPLGPERSAALRAAIDGFFATVRPFDIDGTPVSLELVDVSVPDPELSEFGMPALDWTLRATCAVAPNAVTVRWQTWERMDCEGAVRLPILFREGRQTRLVFVDANEPEFIWRRSSAAAALRTTTVEPLVPRSAVGCRDAAASFESVGFAVSGLGVAFLAMLYRGRVRDDRRRRALSAAGALVLVACWPILKLVGTFGRVDPASDPESARVVFERLHRGIYGAFDAGDEGEIYARLSAAAVDEMVQEFYGEIFESLVLRSKGGAFCRIEQIDYASEEVGGPDGVGVVAPERLVRAGAASFAVRCRWRVAGVVSHWGHAHRRVNEYDAEYLVALDGDAWKLAAVRVMDHQRIDRDG